MTVISGEQLAHALAGMQFPARRWQTAAWADFNCASAQLREAVRGIPDQTYTSFEEIMKAMAVVEGVPEASTPQALVNDGRPGPAA